MELKREHGQIVCLGGRSLKAPDALGHDLHEILYRAARRRANAILETSVAVELALRIHGLWDAVGVEQDRVTGAQMDLTFPVLDLLERSDNRSVTWGHPYETPVARPHIGGL